MKTFAIFVTTVHLLCMIPFISSSQQDGVVVKLRNDSGEIVTVHWMHPQTKQPHLMSQVMPNKTYTVNSFYNHQFQVHQEPDEETGLCGSSDSTVDDSTVDNSSSEGECKINYFAVVHRPEQTTIIKKGIEIETQKPDLSFLVDAIQKHEEAQQKAGSKSDSQNMQSNIEALVTFNKLNMSKIEEPVNVVGACKSKALKEANELKKMNDDNKVSEEDFQKHVVQSLRDCMVNGITPWIKYATDEVEFERVLRVEQANMMENFTCIDPDIELSTPLRDEDWTLEEIVRKTPEDVVAPVNTTRTVHIMHDRPASQIHVIENFATEEECAAMEADAENNLYVASTADGKGGTKISVGRKAMQAGLRPQFNPDGTPKDGSLISQLSGRVYQYVNHALGLNITYEGQEPLMSIQYFGRGRNDTEPDRYTPHCDGKCEGRPHDYGSRMATTVIYCTVPEEGGNTNFNQANVHVKASKGSAVFFSYMDPEEKVMDYGFTTHSGCPVFRGEKKIVTQWVRYGVDASTPHSSFNTLQILHSEAVDGN